MVNTDDFTKRLQEIMEFYELSAASFADRIEVGRSSISHLLSGRNNPSLDFVLKIVNTFPEVELYWLLNGKGSFPRKENQAASSITSAPVPSSVRQQDLFSEVEKVSPERKLQQKKDIQKIVIFYADGSFEAFEN